MKIKIINSDPDSWYKNRIGKVYVARINEYLPQHYILRNYRTILRMVRKEHAEIINPK